MVLDGITAGMVKRPLLEWYMVASVTLNKVDTALDSIAVMIINGSQNRFWTFP